jgi:hypothetical protein
MLVLIALVASTDALVVLPKVWASSSLFDGKLESLKVKETLSAPDIVQMH